MTIDKMQLCSLSVAYACPYHNPTATMGHTTLTSANRSPTQCHTRCLPSARYFSSVPVDIEGERLTTEVGYNAELKSGEDPVEDDEHADELP